VLKNTVLDGQSLAAAMLLPVPSLQSQCFSPHPIHKVPRVTLVLLLNGCWDCFLLSIVRANLQAPKSNAGPNARGSRDRVLFSSACMLDMAACCRLTRAEGRNRGSRLEHGAVAAAEGHTWCSGQGKWVRRSAAWLCFLGFLRLTRVAPSFFRNRPFQRDIICLYVCCAAGFDDLGWMLFSCNISFLLRKVEDVTTISKSQSLIWLSIKDCTLRVPNKTTTLFLYEQKQKQSSLH